MPDTKEDRLAAYAAELSEVQRRIADLRKAETTIKSLIADEVGTLRGVIVAHGAPVLDVSYGKRFDAEQAAAILASNPELLAQCSETIISATKAKAVLPPAVYELCQRENDAPTIKPKVGK
jgi:hypothetical protein